MENDQSMRAARCNVAPKLGLSSASRLRHAAGRMLFPFEARQLVWARMAGHLAAYMSYRPWGFHHSSPFRSTNLQSLASVQERQCARRMGRGDSRLPATVPAQRRHHQTSAWWTFVRGAHYGSQNHRIRGRGRFLHAHLLALRNTIPALPQKKCLMIDASRASIMRL
jgi:hypothetical protein